MLVVPRLPALTSEMGPLYVVVGVFDGIHRGHSYLLGQLRRQARRRGARAAVVTFDAHPDEVLVGAAPPLVCDPDERLARLAAAGVDLTVVEHFDAALRSTPYDAFIAMITERTHLDGILMTPEAAFGYERRGTPEALAELGRQRGFEVVVVPSFTLAGRPISSSAIRSAVAAGELDVAARLLGRPYAVIGAAAPAAGGVRLTFELPVALPPRGRYLVGVEPFGSEQRSATTPARARVNSEGVEIEDQTWDGVGRLRVEFVPRVESG